MNIKKGQAKLIHHLASEEVYDDSGLVDDGNENEDEGDIPEEYNNVAKEREKAKKLKLKTEKIIDVAVAYKNS